MFEKIKNIFFNENNKKRKNENVLFFIIVLVITLIIVNIIINKDEKTINNNSLNEINNTVQLVKNNNNYNVENDEFERKLANILKSIEGVGDVEVLITYQESNSIIPIYNINNSSSITEEKDANGGTRKITTDNGQKEVIEGKDNNIITEKIVMPIVQGAIITAEGANNVNVRSNIISAIEAVTRTFYSQNSSF